MESTCSCTPGYVCRGNCIIKNISPTDNKKRAYSSSGSSHVRVASEKQIKRMDIRTIYIDLANYAFKHKCCSSNCIHGFVETYNMSDLAKAVLTARQNVYHTNANHAHRELRDILRTGCCKSTGAVETYFDHHGVFSNTANTPRKLKVSYFSLISVLCF